MARKEISTQWDRDNRNAINDNFEELYKSGSDAKEATELANEAKHRADSVQEQFNKVVVEGDSSVEAAQARVKADGTAFETLRDRLNSSDAQLSEKVSKSGDTIGGILQLESEPTDNPDSLNHKTSRIVLESYLKSNRPNNHAGDVLQLMWRNHGAKPFIGWWDGATDPDNPELKAWVGAHDLANNPDAEPHNHWSIEVSDSNGALQTRMAFPYDEDHTNIKTSSADFTVGYGILRVAGEAGMNRDLEFADRTDADPTEARFSLRLDSNNDFRIVARDDNGSPIKAGSPFFIERLTGRVGFGTTSPTHQVHMRSANKALRVEGISGATMTPLFVLDHVNSSRRVLGTQVIGETDYRFIIESSGKMSWGEGNGRDVHLYRERHGILGTDGDLLFSGQKGVLLEDVNGGLWRIKVNTDGTLSTINMEEE